jgi:hypothetical protein
VLRRLVELLFPPAPVSDVSGAEPNEYSLFWRDHVLLWVYVWQRNDPPSAEAVDEVERALRAMPEFHELTVAGDPIAPRFAVWLRRDTPGHDDMIYMERASDVLLDLPGDEVGIEIAFGDY